MRESQLSASHKAALARLNASWLLRRELRAVIRRYGQESEVTVYQAIGVLEIVKLDLVDMLEKGSE